MYIYSRGYYDKTLLLCRFLHIFCGILKIQDTSDTDISISIGNGEDNNG